MVFFNCDACGESVKKNQVEKHYQFKCRNCSVLSCVDCGKDFVGDAYKEHVKCMTEDEKYGGKNYKAKPNANKGERKQEAWTEQVEAAIDKVKEPQLRSLLVRIKGFTNIPRKKAKFENFLQNSVRVQGYLATKAWDAIAAEIPKPEPTTNGASTNGASTSTENGASVNGAEAEEIQPTEEKLNKRERKEERQKAGKKQKKDKRKADGEDTEVPTKKSKKRKHNESEEDQTEEEEQVTKKKKKKRKRKESEVEEEPSTSKKSRVEEDLDTTQETEEDQVPKGKFNWEGIIVHMLRKNDSELPMKKLRKKVLAAYHEHEGSTPKSEEQILAKFNKKVNKNPRFKVAKDRVKLVS